ncbi:hypothetical protein LTR56_015456 [Elasticomyces elasticus]|nr:hypothetical protein LTR22_022647 [Elasticomyces elasticus]KAK3634110.1 hypothetical protein LTR56_015456 [Elasticomyces elasticus]KAK4909970.1 hypothetical protein LTR49_021312 [Elasticomyces elasticus]KAK5754882.1 hypothetical protein LTS12_015005 [Elasticomyces elasticus]
MRALAWEFPNDPSLSGTFTQFILGPSLLIKPVLVPNVDTVNGVFLCIGEGTTWYTLKPVVSRGGTECNIERATREYQRPRSGRFNLTSTSTWMYYSETRDNSFSLVVALDESGQASGSLYLDDVETLVQNSTKLILLDNRADNMQFSYTNICLSSLIEGSYTVASAVRDPKHQFKAWKVNGSHLVTIVDATDLPKGVSLTMAGPLCEGGDVALQYDSRVLRVIGLEEFTPIGAWEREMKLELSY